MLREVFIKNFAIIDELRIRFSEGLTILSGETGAGKSIIIAALNILLGSRADASMIRSGEETAELEALFEIDPESHAAGILSEQGYEKSPELLIRRILSTSNRHRVYINGRLATMQVLAAVTENIAGISGQHEHLRLLKESEHARILDRFGGLEGLRESVAACYHTILPAIRELDDLERALTTRNERIELLESEKSEIEEAAPEPGEDEIREQELYRLKNARSLYEAAGGGVDILYDREDAITDRLAVVTKEIEKAAAIDPELREPASALEEARLHIQDIAQQFRAYLETIEFDPARADRVESRLHTINRLKRKYGPALDDVLSHLARVEEDLSDTLDMDDRIRKARADLDVRHGELVSLARELAEKRREAAKALAGKMEAELASLNMPNTTFDVVFRPSRPRSDTPPHLRDGDSAIGENGSEQPVFMISPNAGEELRPLSRIASGGELSRIILALKSILVDTDPVETVIFDEVDAGIGGQTATVVGRKLAGIAAASQVICITHLAQIATFGSRHLRIEKHVSDGRTSTQITELGKDGRVEETARMIGGQSVTEASRAHARELLDASGVKS